MKRTNVLVSGTPRSGTTLTCHLLNKLPDTVALHEPMNVRQFARLKTAGEICDVIDDFFAEQRDSILTTKTAFSKNVGGKVPDNPIATNRQAEQLRQSVVTRSDITVDKPLPDDFTLVVKHNAVFAAMMESLVTRFPVYAVIRNPLSTIASWTTVDIPVQTGNAPAAERIDPALKQRLAAIPDVLDRQIFLLDWYHAQYRRYLPESSFIRYETIIESGGRVLEPVSAAAAHLDEPLSSQNKSKLYDYPRMLRIGERLLKSDGAYWESYTRASVEQLLEDLSQTPAEATG